MEVCMADQRKPETAGSGSTAKKQPAQSSGQRRHAAEHEETVRKGYDAAQEPEAQGDGDPGVDQISETHDKS
jgi:hypothetical protein